MISGNVPKGAKCASAVWWSAFCYV